ncbi:MAG: ester cyclase [Anderseniella sp.]|nr:ester cyclase [Anderseniella sp.]
MTPDEVIERNKVTVARFLKGTHSNDIRDLAVIDETVVPHIVCHGFPGFPNGEFADRECYKAFFRTFRQSFSDMQFETVRTIATTEYVSAHWVIHASHTGEFRGVEPDGAIVVFDGVALYRMEDGKIAETWLTINEPLLVSQLGKPARQSAA